MSIVLMLFTGSCTPDDEAVAGSDKPWQNQIGSNPPFPSFVNKGWQMTAITPESAIDFNGDGTIDSDLMPFLRPATMKPIRFEQNGRFGFVNESRDAPMSGTWTYQEATKTLTIADASDPASGSEWAVIESSVETLRVKTKITEDGKTHNAVIIWKAL